jgi:hypothetical protein
LLAKIGVTRNGKFLIAGVLLIQLILGQIDYFHQEISLRHQEEWEDVQRKTAISIDDDTTVATLADTVLNLQRSVERLTKEMAAVGNKVAKEESRGDIIAVRIDSLEDTQKVLSESLID